MDDSLFLLLALVFLGAMLFYSSRKRKKTAEVLRSQVVQGSYVMLTSGIFGKVAAVHEDRVELEISPGSKMLVALGAIRAIEQEPKLPKAAGKKATASVRKPAAKTKPSAKKK
jgi:preprotein translocase subunit YajC